MKKIFILFIFIINLFFIKSINALELSYSSHIQSIGWQDYVLNDKISGTEGKKLRLESFKINLSENEYNGTIMYSAYVNGEGWQDYVSNNELSGTEGKSKKLEAIRVKLTEELEEHYDIYYRVHVSDYGWLDWAKNNSKAGVIGYNKQIESIQIRIVEKGSDFFEPADNYFYSNEINLSYSSHIQNIGWQSYVLNDRISGTEGKKLRLESLKIKVQSPEYKGTIMYSTYINGEGWQDYVQNDQISGTVGRGKKLEAIRIKLTEELEEHYDIYYRVHVSDYGWLDWAKNNSKTGVIGFNKQIESIQIKVIEKDSKFIESMENSLYSTDASIMYNSYIQGQGWQNNVSNGEISGTEGKKLKISSLKIMLSETQYTGTLKYSVYTASQGWQDFVCAGKSIGNINQSNRLEGLKIKLTEELEEIYDVYYRVHVSNYGWLDWVRNDQQTGVIGFGESIEAIQINFIKKGSDTYEEAENYYFENNNYLTYSSHVQNIGWQDYVFNGEISGTQNLSKRLEAIKIKINNQDTDGSIEYSLHVQNIGWQDYKKNDEIAGTVGESKRVEAIKIRLSGDLEQQYDVYYRAYIQNYGWLDWAKNDEIAGSIGVGLRMESFQIMLVDKDSQTIGSNELTYIKNGFVTQNGKTYFINNDGKKVTGFYSIAGTKYFFATTGELLYKNALKVIDVSHYQGTIDWMKVKNSDVDGAIVRMGYGTTDTGSPVMDQMFVTNMSMARSLNLLRGIYLYSYAINKVSAQTEANYVVSVLRNHGVPKNVIIYYDLESNKYTQNLTSKDYDTIVSTFVNTLKSAGYSAQVYTYKNLAETKFSDYVKGMTTWIAQYNVNCSYNGSYNGWQFTSSGSISGISGNVDISVFKK